MEKRTEELAKARARYAEAQENLSNLDKAYQEADASLESLKALLLAARIQVDRKAAEIKRYEDSNSGI
jgi:multidrug resistance efflux pump